MPIFHIMNHVTTLYKGQPWNHSVQRTVHNGRQSDHGCSKIELTITKIQFSYLQSLIRELKTLGSTTLDFPIIKPVSMMRCPQVKII